MRHEEAHRSRMRRNAAECLDLVERLANPDDKARLIEMAQNFLKMAEQQDVREKKGET
jgi:hypothetical protein